MVATRTDLQPARSPSDDDVLVTIPDDIYEAQQVFMDLGWGDGLPLIPPTPERVDRMLAGTTRDPDELVGVVLPRGGEATVRAIAVNAVLAGCKPEYMPVIIAALEATLEPKFNLNGVNTTGHNCCPLIVVSGPIVKQLDINAGMGLFGPGWRSNATIGRALHLCNVNIGGAIAPTVDRAVHAHPGKYTYCIGEDADFGPWSKLNEDYGFRKDESMVLVLPAEAPYAICGRVEKGGGKHILYALADSCLGLGLGKSVWLAGEMLVVFSPSHAELLFEEGWTKRDVQNYLFENARHPVKELKRLPLFEIRRDWPKWIDENDLEQMVPIVEDPEQFVIMATPGGNVISSLVPTWGLARGAFHAVGT
jgi:hypothetical protein